MGASVYLSKPGVLCAAGSNADELWNSVTDGKQDGIRKVTALNEKTFFAGRIADDVLCKPSSARYDMRIMRIEELCLRQIEADIERVKTLYGAEKIGVCVGSCDNGTEFSLAGHRTYFESGSFPSDYSLEIQGADYVAAFIREKYLLSGPCLTFSTACSSSAGAIVKAAELLKSGICDAVIAGGVDIASDTVLMGFDSLEAVSSEITNPFSKNRHGITLGEAAAFFVMTRDMPEGNAPFARLLGWGESADAYHMTSPEPGGDGAFRAMKSALASAGLNAADVDYINLHGTGTKFNDSMEAKAVDALFGGRETPVLCSTTKPLTGHTLGAAGALEAAVCFLSIVNNIGKAAGEIKLPVQVWDGVQDEELPFLNIVSKGKNCAAGKVRVCMSNSFAFGGANSSLILGL